MCPWGRLVCDRVTQPRVQGQVNSVTQTLTHFGMLFDCLSIFHLETVVAWHSVTVQRQQCSLK